MNNKMTKAELQTELRAAEKQILELESSLKKVTEQSQLSTAGTPSSAENEALFSRVFQISPNPMALSDLETSVYVEVNDAFIRTFGYTKEEIIGRTARDLHLFVDPDQRDQLVTVMKAQGYLRDANLTLRTKTGQIRHGVFSVDLVQVHGHNLLLTAMNDITDSKQNQDVLLKSEARFVTIFENSPVAISITRISDMKIIHVNSAFMKMYGFSREEILGHTAAELGIWADLNERQRFVDLLKTQKKVTDFEAVAKYRSGKEKNMLISGEVVEIDNEACFLVQIIDITERKQAELELHQSWENYKTLFENNPHPMWVYDRETLAFLMVNDAAIQHYGYSREEFLKMTILDIRPSEDHKALKENVGRVTDGLNQAGIWRHIKKDGSLVYVEIASHTLEFNGRKAELVHADDVTERVRATSALQASEANYRNLVEKSESAIAVVDRDGKILFANEKGKDIWHETEFIGKTIYDVFPQEYANRYLTAIRSVIDSQISIMDEIESVVAGKSMWFRISMTPLRNPDATVSSLVLNAWDITDNKIAEQLLRESEIRARAMLDAYPDLMFRMNREGIFLDYKADVQDLYPQDTPSLIGLRNRDVTPPEFSSLIEKKIQESLNSGKLQTFEYQLPLADQKVHDFEARMTPSGKDEVVAVVRDITNRKNLEREILQVNERFTELAESVSDIFWVTQPKIRKHLYVNPAFAVITGFSAEAVDNLPNGYLDIVVPEDQHIVIKVREQEDNGLKTDTKYRILQPDGSIRWIHDRATPVFDETGNVVRVVGVSSDITEQVEAEKRLNESETRFRQIAETIPEVFWVFDNEQNQLAYISPAFESVWGYSGRTIYENDEIFIEAILPEDRNLMFTSMEKQNRGEHTEIEYRIVRSDGSIRWIHDRSSPVFDELDGHLKRTAGIATDITEQKLAGDALRDREERLRLTLDASHQGLYDLNLQTGEAITNREYAEMLGYSSETFVETDKAWMERLHPDDKERTVHTYLSYINGLIPEYRTEFRQMTKDGKWKWILSVGKIVENDPTGKPLRMLGIHLDIDANKQAELELHRRASQLSLLNDVGKKIAGVLDIQGVLDLSANLVHDSFGYHHVGLFTINDEKSHMLMRAKSGEYSSKFPDNHSIKLGEGIVGTVGLSGEMVLTNQVNEDPIYINFFPEALDTVSELGLPIKYAGRVIGVLDVQSPLPNAFSADDIQVLQTLADQVAIALENARLYESGQIELAERQKLIYDLEKLVEAGHALSESLNPQAIYPLIYSYVSKVMPCDFVIVSSYDPEFELIRCEYLHTPEGPQQVTNFPPIPLEPPGQGTQSLVIRSGKSLLLSDYEKALQTTNNTLYFNEQAEIVDETYEEDDRTRSAVLVPLKVNGIVTGVLQVLSTKLNAHTQEHLRYTEALAFHVSSALSNARLFSELEERVRQRTAEVQDLYDNAPAGYHSLDINGKIMLINQTELNWLGYTREEMIGHLFSDFLTQESVQTFQQTFPIFKYHGNLSDLELNLVCKDGSVLPVLVNAIAVKDEDGNYLMSRSTVFDNTERKKAELALQDREKVYRALFESANDAIFLLQPDGTILGANPRSSDLLGIPHEDLVGKHALDFIANEENKEAEGQTDRVLAGETLPVYERTFIRNDGTLVNTEINLSLIRDETNKPKYIQSVVRDISGRKRAEETLRLANAEMERALRLKDEFLANMSHELRTPLNAILGITESLLEQISGSLNEKQQKYLQTVLESAQHLLELINDILDLAKINAGRIELDISRVDINSVIHTSMRMIRELAQKKGLNVNLEVDPTVIATWADERRLKQMLVNLLSNAVKFTPKGGEIGLIIHGNKSDQVLNFTVWDTGIGIKQEDIRLLFQPFVQLDAGLARGSQGTGLGLVLVSQMARLHGGSVTVESEPQQGSRFTITIPWVTMEKQDRSLRETHLQPPVIESSVEKKPAKDNLILLVEDTDAVTMLISDYLKRHGYKVVTARDGFEGIARINETVPDLILMDVMMPELDGIETTRRIRTQLGLSHIPIIALTALAMAGDRERCLEAGMNGYLSKPVKLKELLETIEHYLKPGKEGLQ